MVRTFFYKHYLQVLLLGLIIGALTSCNSLKRVPEDEFLLVKNTIYVDSVVTKDRRQTNLLEQKPNSKVLGIPLGVYIYNLAKEHPDSVFDKSIQRNERRYRRYKKIFSAKQVERMGRSYTGFNEWLKRTGSAPEILDASKIERSKTQIKAWYWNQGWFNANIEHEQDSIKPQKAEVSYQVTPGKQYVLDSINPKIQTPKLLELYKSNLNESHLKPKNAYKTLDFNNEQNRLTQLYRNQGFFYFERDAISFLADTVDTNHKVNIDLIINNRRITSRDTTYLEPYKQYTINQVNIYPDFGFATANDTITETNTYRDYNINTYGSLNYGLRSLTSFVFFKPGDLYTDRDRNFTINRINSLGLFRYPNVEFVVDPEDSTQTGLIANILLTPEKKFRLSAGLDATHNNIQTIGLGLQTSLIWRNPLKSAGIFDIGIRGNIGSSKNAAKPEDPFFDITELGITANFTLPGILFPAKTDRIISKYKTPFTRLNTGISLQENIGLDRRSINGALQYLWKPKSNVSAQLDLLNLQFIRNLNPERYFAVFVSSFDRLNAIARRSNYIPPNENLDPIEDADVFIEDVLAGNVAGISEEDFVAVNNIRERQERISQNNLIASGSFSWLKDTRETLFDRNFYLIRYRLELAGNLLSLLSEGLGGDTDSNGDKQLFGVTYSQYIKGEIEYVKHWDISDFDSFGIRVFTGLAVPYGNSNSIPFIRSFFAGGANDNRAWRPYALGPGSSGSIDEFNEANLKLSLNAEYRYKILGALNGAFFVDAGNVWNVFDNVEEEGAVFTGIDSLKDIGIGSGFGLRYDFNYFVIRFDIGFKTYNPALPEGDRWFKEFNFGNAVYNFGINYPF